jgi:hypothetical protein
MLVYPCCLIACINEFFRFGGAMRSTCSCRWLALPPLTWYPQPLYVDSLTNHCGDCTATVMSFWANEKVTKKRTPEHSYPRVFWFFDYSGKHSIAREEVFITHVFQANRRSYSAVPHTSMLCNYPVINNAACKTCHFCFGTSV